MSRQPLPGRGNDSPPLPLRRPSSVLCLLLASLSFAASATPIPGLSSSAPPVLLGAASSRAASAPATSSFEAWLKSLTVALPQLPEFHTSVSIIGIATPVSLTLSEATCDTFTVSQITVTRVPSSGGEGVPLDTSTARTARTASAGSAAGSGSSFRNVQTLRLDMTGMAFHNCVAKFAAVSLSGLFKPKGSVVASVDDAKLSLTIAMELGAGGRPPPAGVHPLTQRGCSISMSIPELKFTGGVEAGILEIL